MSFDVGKWFDEWDAFEKFEMKRSFGEKSLKEWFNKTIISCKWYEELDMEFKWQEGDADKSMAVSCLGEKRCLELLKKWWEEK